jgi:hypothetical protein
VKLPNWFRIVWWLALTALLSTFLFWRLPQLSAGQGTLIDGLVFVIWVCLLLAPLFTEVTMLGLKFKQHVDDMERRISAQLTEMRTDVRTAVNTTFSPQFHMPNPPPDSQLPAIEEMVKKAIQAAVIASPSAISPPAFKEELDKDVEYLLLTRYRLEREVRRLLATTDNGSALVDRRLPFWGLLKALVDADVIDSWFSNAMREVYSICSPAVHGEPVTKGQIEFVKEIAPQLFAKLGSINPDTKSTP